MKLLALIAPARAGATIKLKATQTANVVVGFLIEVSCAARDYSPVPVATALVPILLLNESQGKTFVRSASSSEIIGADLSCSRASVVLSDTARLAPGK
jgi:hypothetical protein